MLRIKPYRKLLSRLAELRKFIQILAGPRHIGKMTFIQRIISDVETSVHATEVKQPHVKYHNIIESDELQFAS